MNRLHLHMNMILPQQPHPTFGGKQVVHTILFVGHKFLHNISCFILLYSSFKYSRYIYLRFLQKESQLLLFQGLIQHPNIPSRNSYCMGIPRVIILCIYSFMKITISIVNLNAWSFYIILILVQIPLWLLLTIYSFAHFRQLQYSFAIRSILGCLGFLFLLLLRLTA